MHADAQPGGPDRRLEVPGAVRVETMDDEVVILDERTERFYAIAGVGRTVWEEIAASGSEAAAADRVVDAFDVDAQRARADVRGFVDDLIEAGLVIEAAPPV